MSIAVLVGPKANKGEQDDKFAFLTWKNNVGDIYKKDGSNNVLIVFGKIGRGFVSAECSVNKKNRGAPLSYTRVDSNILVLRNLPLEIYRKAERKITHFPLAPESDPDLYQTGKTNTWFAYDQGLSHQWYTKIGKDLWGVEYYIMSKFSPDELSNWPPEQADIPTHIRDNLSLICAVKSTGETPIHFSDGTLTGQSTSRLYDDVKAELASRVAQNGQNRQDYYRSI